MFFGCGGDEGSGSLDISGIADFPKLELVAFRACEVEDLYFLAELDRLQWLALPSDLTQSQFAAVVSDLPDLVFLEALESEEITDLSPLAGLPRLKGLMVEDDAPLDPLFELDQLEYLAVMAGGSDSTFVSEVLEPLQAELPTTVIGRVEPFCLGSGYILLLIPMVGLAALVVRRRRRTPIPTTKNG